MPTDPAPDRPGAVNDARSSDDTLSDNWSALCAQEQQAIAQRRQLAQGDKAGAEQQAQLPRVGLALSGGGIRSATFALGDRKSVV